MEEIINFHHYVMVYLFFIFFAVAYIMVDTTLAFTKDKKAISHKYLIHGTFIEVV
jgi:hypothetical protein